MAEDGDVERIAAKEDDVVADPSDGKLLIHQAVVAGKPGSENAVAIGIGFLGGEGGMIAVGRDGSVALPYNSEGMKRDWLDVCGDIASEVF